MLQTSLCSTTIRLPSVVSPAGIQNWNDGKGLRSLTHSSLCCPASGLRRRLLLRQKCSPNPPPRSIAVRCGAVVSRHACCQGSGVDVACLPECSNRRQHADYGSGQHVMGGSMLRGSFGLLGVGYTHLGIPPTVALREGRKRPRGRRKAALGSHTPIAPTEEEPSRPGVPDSGKTSVAEPERPFLDVPWGAGKIVQVMFYWFLAFWFLGYWVVPVSLELLGVERDELSSRGQALLHLVLDFGEMGVTIGVLWCNLRRYRPLALGWFRTWVRPLRRWAGHVALALAAFPLVDLAATHSQVWFPTTTEPWGANLLEQSLATGDTITNALYFIVVTACAPLWEEAIFRGFLLPSLAKYFPIGLSVFFSSVVFAAAHFSLQRFLPLMLLGIILGTLFVRTRNLLSCITFHSLWNAYIFYQLTCRASTILVWG